MRYPLNTAYVYFFDGNWPFKKPLLWKVLDALTERATGSPLVHCAIGDADCVLSVTRQQTVYHMASIILRLRNLRDVIEVPLKNPVEFEGRAEGGKWIWPSILKWATAGRITLSRDCGDVTKEILAEGGWPVPRWVVAPGDLHAWLLNKGFRRVRVSDNG